jgi:hypothetical protein
MRGNGQPCGVLPLCVENRGRPGGEGAAAVSLRVLAWSPSLSILARALAPVVVGSGQAGRIEVSRRCSRGC